MRLHKIGVVIALQVLPIVEALPVASLIATRMDAILVILPKLVIRLVIIIHVLWNGVQHIVEKPVKIPAPIADLHASTFHVKLFLDGNAFYSIY
jgi:hypothetical protein